jgi:hypothetical protein
MYMNAYTAWKLRNPRFRLTILQNMRDRPVFRWAEPLEIRMTKVVPVLEIGVRRGAGGESVPYEMQERVDAASGDVLVEGGVSERVEPARRRQAETPTHREEVFDGVRSFRNARALLLIEVGVKIRPDHIHHGLWRQVLPGGRAFFSPYI